MKTSHTWLQQYIDIPWNPAKLADALTMAGLEVEDRFTINDLPADVVVAEILERRPHPNADKLSVCLVNDGSPEPLHVVCGAPNCDAGSKAVLARVGVTLPGGLTLKKAKIRGEESFGMLCAKDELGLGEDHSGIIILPPDAPVGTPYAELLGVDTVTDWEITPNRPDWLSHYGIAREIGALTGNVANLPQITLAETPGTDVNSLAKVIVEAPDLCPRYTARVIRGITIGPSPRWLQDRLSAVGLRPINNVVDVTNFVMLELGQPLHAFDYDQLAEHTIVVRRAAPGETITTLDSKPHKLPADALLIADAARGVALAGIMGGENSEISAATTTVLLESAAFNPVNIRATRKQLGVSTDSSYRFERGIDVEGVELASARAAQLICEVAGGELIAGMIDARAGAYVPPRVACRYQRVRDLMGVDLAAGEIVGIFERLGLGVEDATADGCTVVVPSFRLDLLREADLIEEVARIYGLERIPAAIPVGKIGGERNTDTMYPLQQLRRQLLGLGLDECLTNTFSNPPVATHCTGIAPESLHRVSNPIGAEFSVLRPSLLPDMVNVVARNVARDNHDLALFEIGKAYTTAADQPEEHRELVIALTGRRHPERFSAELAELVDFYDLRGLLDSLLDLRRIGPAGVARAEHPSLRPGHAAELSVGGKVIGVFGEAAPELVAHTRLKHPLLLAVIDADALLGVQPPPAEAKPLPQFPGTARDIALVADETLSHEQVVEAIGQLKVKNLVGVALFDIFRDEKALGAGRKSMAYSLTFRNPERTLTDKEVNKAYDLVRAKLPELLPVELR